MELEEGISNFVSISYVWYSEMLSGELEAVPEAL